LQINHEDNKKIELEKIPIKLYSIDREILGYRKSYQISKKTNRVKEQHFPKLIKLKKQ
jgi:hypothetical protein